MADAVTDKSGPPDKPGYKIVVLDGNVITDDEYILENWADRGYRVVAVYATNKVILQRGYK